MAYTDSQPILPSRRLQVLRYPQGGQVPGSLGPRSSGRVARSSGISDGSANAMLTSITAKTIIIFMVFRYLFAETSPSQCVQDSWCGVVWICCVSFCLPC